MTHGYEPLDFELEEPFQIAPPPIKKKKKLIGLDDLLEDFEKEQKKIRDKNSKQKKIQKISDADDEFDAAEAQLSEYVDKCQQEINQMNGEDEMPTWGVHVFGHQEQFPQLECPEVKSSVLFQSLMNDELNSLVEPDVEKGEYFLEGFLADGWLLQLVYACNCVEKSIAAWTFDLMLYSSKLKLMHAACEFWCHILSPKYKDKSSSIKIGWLPKFLDLKAALKTYGFLLDSSSRISSDIDMVPADDETTGPPQNIRSWIKFAAVCCKIRETHNIFSAEEAAELLVIIISLFLDRIIVGLSMELSDCMLSVINFFRDEEWSASCKKIAKTLACRLPRDINCLRLVESITGVDTRSKHLRSAVAFQFLATSLDEKAFDAEDILNLLASIKLKDKNSDLLKMYIYLTLADNWLVFDPLLKHDEAIRKQWSAFLRNCSCGINITDMRSYASNVRLKVSYLLQGTKSKWLM